MRLHTRITEFSVHFKANGWSETIFYAFPNYFLAFPNYFLAFPNYFLAGSMLLYKKMQTNYTGSTLHYIYLYD